MFSASAVSYLIVTGRAPFTRPDLRQTLNALIAEDPAPIQETDAPVELFRVLSKGLAKIPADRHQSCREMLVDLQGEGA
jgi:serine/threonine protein kinase